MQVELVDAIGIETYLRFQRDEEAFDIELKAKIAALEAEGLELDAALEKKKKSKKKKSATKSKSKGAGAEDTGQCSQLTSEAVSQAESSSQAEQRTSAAPPKEELDDGDKKVSELTERLKTAAKLE